jgi:hypothetical protein
MIWKYVSVISGGVLQPARQYVHRPQLGALCLDAYYDAPEMG